MIPFSLLLKPRYLLAVGALALVGGALLYVSNLRSERDDLRRANLVLEHSIETFELKGRINQHAMEELRKAIAHSEMRMVELNKIKKEIADAPETDDGPIAPVLARTLDSLR